MQRTFSTTTAAQLLTAMAFFTSSAIAHAQSMSAPGDQHLSASSPTASVPVQPDTAPEAPAPAATEDPDIGKEDGESAETALPKDTQPDPYVEAKERVARAEKLYEEGNYDAALTEFQRAYDTMLGHAARSYVLYNIGRCQEKLYRYDAAIESYKSYLEEAGPEADDRSTVIAKIELLEGLLGVVRVSVSAKKGTAPGKYQLWVDGRLIGEDTVHFSIPSGNHEVEIRADGYQAEAQEVQVAARQEKTLTFQLSPLAKEYKGIKPTYFFVTGGLAVAAGAVGGVYGVMTLNKHNEIQNTEGPLVTEDDKNQIQHRALMADIFLISAGVLATSATVLAFLTDWSGQERPESPGAGDVRLKTMSFGASPRGGLLLVTGTF